MRKWGKKEITEKQYITGGKGGKRNEATKDESWLFVYLMLSSNHYLFLPCLMHNGLRTDWEREEKRENWGSEHSTCLSNWSLFQRTPARTWPKPPAARLEAHTYLPMFMEVISSLKHVNPAWKKSMLWHDSQSRQQPDTWFTLNSRGIKEAL